jgi:hypothetical protein
MLVAADDLIGFPLVRLEGGAVGSAPYAGKWRFNIEGMLDKLPCS